jgi:hypothetical protein
MMRGAKVQEISVAWRIRTIHRLHLPPVPGDLLYYYAIAGERQSCSLYYNTIDVYFDNEIKKINAVVFHNGNNFIHPSAVIIIIQSV